MTRNPSASAATVGEKRDLRPAEPVERDDRVAGARVQGGERARACPYRLELEAPRLGHAARGRQQPDAEVKVVPDRQPTGAERLHPAAEIGGHCPPGGVVSLQQCVGLTVRVDETRLPVIDERVPRPAVGHFEADARPCGWGVENLGVVALDERAQGTGRRGHDPVVDIALTTVSTSMKGSPVRVRASASAGCESRRCVGGVRG